nr:putative ribonuclease H-like domain-containing protein [Tanacetum cinerariifolium]
SYAEQAFWSQYSVQTDEPTHSGTTIVTVLKELPKVSMVDVVPLVPKLRKNRTAHIDYIKHTLEEAATLRELVESERLLSPLNTSLSYAYSIATSSVIKSVSNVNSNLKCASCNGCLFSDNHDACVVEYIDSMNASRKSKSVKKPVKRKVWKTTGKVFKTVGYKWTPTGRTFTLVGNVCPLTRIATATIVPHREPIPIVKSMDKPVVTLVVQIVLWYLDSGCSKHMTGDRSQLINFVQKFLGTVKFRNDHVAKIMGYGAYQIGNVRLNVPARCIRTDNETEFVNQTLRDYYEEVGISHETSVACPPQQNGVVERHNRTLIEATRTMLIYTQAPLFLWAEAVATACFTQNRSIVRLRHGKTPNVIVPKANSFQKLPHKVDEKLDVPGHMLETTRVDAPQTNLDNLPRNTVEFGNHFLIGS